MGKSMGELNQQNEENTSWRSANRHCLLFKTELAAQDCIMGAAKRWIETIKLVGMIDHKGRKISRPKYSNSGGAMLVLLTLICACFAAFTASVAAQDMPTSLACSSNAKASRDYGFEENRWSGVIPPVASKVFGITTSRQGQQNAVLRDKIFSSLNTSTPVIRSITPPGDAAEFKGVVVSRWADSVFIMWENDHGNKIWLAVVNLTHKRA
jgi:hypothetical protein